MRLPSIARAAFEHSACGRGRAIPAFCLLFASLCALLSGCGGRTPLDPGELGAPRPVISAEQCNGLDDDRDGNVDEIFRDATGRYVDEDHCGGCGRACSRDPLPNASSQGCGVLDTIPSCVAFTCAPGFGLSQSGSCVALDDRLCLACQADGDCGPLTGAACIDVGGELRCARPCGDGCPDGYVCQPELGCVPAGNSCNCSGTSESFDVACRPLGASGECTGRARCENGALSECVSPVERCDGDDDDCDGLIDEDFVDARGAYSVDAHCGSCGVDCGLDMPVTSAGPIQLTCGGDPFAPSCVTLCPEARDGVQRGDHLDADRLIDNGCECEVRALVDTPGAPVSEGQLDANCDGADGDVLASFYVSVDGDDSGPGSPTRPLRTINVAVERAAASLSSGAPRPHVFAAAGVYIESVAMRDGVRLHGGYSSDFLALSTSNFEVIVVAPANTSAQFGAALTIDRAGRSPTLVEGIRFRGRDGIDGGAPAVGAVIVDPRNQLVLRALEISSGKPAAGAAGGEGEAGDTPLSDAAAGAPPRAALESGAHECSPGNSNVTRGGEGGVSRCNGGSDVSGGLGGSASCPVSEAFQASGNNGRSGFGGLGGDGGQDVVGPILSGPSCPFAVRCGLADFRVAGELAFAQAGMPGADGSAGNAGSACSDPFGTFMAAGWIAGNSTPGASGGPGGGGGGGGAGGGAQMMWMDGSCQFADGLGGGGGGGGGGGCGGAGGGAGQAGGVSVALLVRATASDRVPVIQDVTLIAQDGSAGGEGGAGGDGGLGGSGGLGGDVPDALRSTPTMAGVMAGQRGGKGGNGGAGGGGGGGCGGSTVGLWITGTGVDGAVIARLRDGNGFELGAPGRGGRGGGGALPAAAGTSGGSADVLVK